MKTRTTLLLLLVAMISGSAASNAGPGNEVISQWRTRAISIDGNSRDWTGIPRVAVNEEFTLAALNDGTSLYLCLMASGDRPGEGIPGGGLTVWIDAQGGSEKRFGMRYPLGTGAGTPPPSDFDAPPVDAVEMGPPDTRGFDVEILEPGEQDQMTTARAGEKGFFMKIGRSYSGTVYELQLPLARLVSNLKDLNAHTPLVFGVGLESSGPMYDSPEGGMCRLPRPGWGTGWGRPDTEGPGPEFDPDDDLPLDFLIDDYQCGIGAETWFVVKLAGR